MSNPRSVQPHQTVLLTRKCVQAQFLLTPDGELNFIILYNLQEWAERHGVELHAIIVESNHLHLVATDRRGLLPDFIRDFHAFVTRAVNRLLGRSGALWDERQTSVVVCATPEDAFRELIYTITNPVKDHLVERAHEWPGVNSLDYMFRAPQRVERPKQVGGKKSSRPESVQVQFTRPPGFEHLSEEEWKDKVYTAVREVEECAARERAENRAAHHRQILEMAAQRAADKKAARDRARRERRQVAAAALSPGAAPAPSPVVRASSPAEVHRIAPTDRIAPRPASKRTHRHVRSADSWRRLRGRPRVRLQNNRQPPPPPPPGVTRVLGVLAIVNQDRLSSPPPKEKRGRQINPTVAAKDPAKRHELLLANKAWRAAYRLAFQAHQDGEHDVHFPYGTWQRRLHSAVRCRQAPGLLPIPYAAALRTA